MARILSYEKKNTWIHELSGVTKLLFFLIWTFTSMLTYDTRVLVVMVILSLIIFKMSRTEWRQVGTVFLMVLFFLILNIAFVFILSPYQGCTLYGNKCLKYFTVVPAVFMFLVTTDPSEFAAALNKIGVSYNIGYAISIALRYIPDVQKDFTNIKNAQASRGIEMSSKAGLFKRIKNSY